MNIATLNPPREDGFPKIVEISPMKKPKQPTVFYYTKDPKDPIFDQPIKVEDFSEPTKGKLIFKVIQKNV